LPQTPPRAWAEHIKGLRPNIPLAGIPLSRWRTYCEDSGWLVDCHGHELAAAGFTLEDLFEIIPGQPGTGGLVEMLRGARSISIREGRASFCRGRLTFHFEATGDRPADTGWVGRAPWQPR